MTYLFLIVAGSLSAASVPPALAQDQAGTATYWARCAGVLTLKSTQTQSANVKTTAQTALSEAKRLGKIEKLGDARIEAIAREEEQFVRNRQHQHVTAMVAYDDAVKQCNMSVYELKKKR